MENSTEVSTDSVVMKEEPELMEITPSIEHEDFIDAAATSLLSDSTAQNPYAEQMLKDGLSYADIDYFIKSFSNINNVKFEKIHCTCCNKHVGTAVETTERYTHPLLQVVICENCYMFYCSGDFETDKDGSELYCRWCGEGGQVFCCSKCPYVFCKKCISRNLGRGMAPEIECMEDWLCFNCNPCQISKQRATCWAITKYAQETKELSEFSPNIKSQMYTDFSTCCKSKRALAKAGILPTPKRQKTDSPKLKQALQNDESQPVEEIAPVVWQNSEEPQDEVICTPDILPFEESPPSSPPPLVPMEYAPPPGVRGLNAPPNVPVVKRVVLPKIMPKNNPVIKVAIPPKEPKPLTPKPTPKTAPKPIRNTTPMTKVANVVPTTQKITVPVQRGVVNSDEQWFGTAVIRSAEVTEYISSKVSMLAFMNSNENVNNDKREEIYRSFQSHLDIAIAKLKNIKQNMTSSYKRLIAKQANQTNQPTVQKVTPPQPIIQPVVIIPPETTPPKPVIKKPMRTSARKKSVSYVESSTDDEEWRQTESDEDYSSGSTRKRYRKKKNTPKKSTPEPKFNELIKPVDITSIVKTPVDNKIILDVIDLVDDDSNDGVPTEKQKNVSDEEQEIVPDIDSDISEILPDHLVETELSDGEKTKDKKETIEIDDDNKSVKNEIDDTQSTMPKSSSDNENSQEKVESNIDSCSNMTNTSEKNEIVKENNGNSDSHKFSDINKNKTELENDESSKKDDEMREKEEETLNDKDKKLQNGDSSPKVDNDLSDNAVDNNLDKNGKKSDETPEILNEDFEAFLSSSVIKNKSEKDNYGDEFSKFVTNSKSSLSEEDIEDVVNNMYEQTDDALSLPPQNSLDFAMDFKEEIKKKDKNVEDKTSLENELNVLRKLAENCVSTEAGTNV